MSAGTTSLSELPSNTGGPNANTVIRPLAQPEQNKVMGEAPMYKNDLDEKSPHIPTVDMSQMNKLAAGLEKAKEVGATKLPPRDIPRNSGTVHQDAEAKPNFVPRQRRPAQPREDYVQNYETAQSVIEKQEKQEAKKDTIDTIYDELQAPVLIGFLFFVFQLPFVRGKLAKTTPFLFAKDGNMNMSGFVVLSMTFALLYYAIQKILKHFSSIKI